MITQPMDFNEAIGFLLDKDQIPASWDAAHWALMEPEARIRAFFSAKVENARFLDRAQGLLFDYMAKVRDDVTTPDGEKTTVLRVGGREDFVKLMRDFMVAEGMVKEEDFPAMNQNDVQTLGSMARLRLIFDTNVRQAYGYGQWKQGMTPAALRAFPAARLVRMRGVAEARPRHAAHIGQVRAKTDVEWWAKYQNDPLIGGFGVPWGPYGFHSGVDQESVSREEAAALGVAIPPPPAELPGLNDGLSASTRKMSPALKAKLLAELRGGPAPADPREAAKQAAAQVRREMLNRGLAEALGKGDAAKAEKYRAAINILPPVGLPVREEAEKIVLESAPAAVMVPVLPTNEDVKDSPAEGYNPAEVLAGIRAIRPTEQEGAGIAREIRADREAESLARWADAQGVLEVESRAPQADELTGGEHLVTLDESGGIVYKSTHPGKFGFSSDVEMVRPRGRKEKPRITAGLVDATPNEYLARLDHQNGIFNDDVRVLGVARFPQGLSVLTSQPFYKGARTEQPAIDAWFEARGWRKLPHKDGAFHHQEKGLIIMDALPRNVLTLDTGEIMPFDVVIVTPSVSLREKLGI